MYVHICVITLILHIMHVFHHTVVQYLAVIVSCDTVSCTGPSWYARSSGTPWREGERTALLQYVHSPCGCLTAFHVYGSQLSVYLR